MFGFFATAIDTCFKDVLLIMLNIRHIIRLSIHSSYDAHYLG